MFAEMGYPNVSTYIQSGNVIFKAFPQDEVTLSDAIKDQIADRFSYDIPVIVCSADDMRKIFDQFPFNEKDSWKMYLTFLSEQPTQNQIKKLEAKSSEIETFNVGDRVVYIEVNKQASKKPVFSSNFIQKQLDINATNRNIRTVRKLLSLSSSH